MSSSIIQDLIDEGVVALYFDPRSGSFRDWSGSGNHVTPTAPTDLNRDGANLNHSGKMDIAASTSLAFTSEGSIIARFPKGYAFNPAGINYLLYLRSSAALSPYCTTLTFGLQIQTVFSQNGVSPLGSKGIACNFKPTEYPEFFQNGVQIASGTTLLPALPTGAATGYIGHPNTYIRQVPSTHGAVLICTRKLTATEHSQVYAELASYDESWPTKVFSRNRGYVEIDPNETGLVAGWNMRPVSGQIIDQSPNGNDGNITGPVFWHSPIGPSLYYRRNGNKTSCAHNANQWLSGDASFEAWLLKDNISYGTIIAKYNNIGAQRSFVFGLIGNGIGLARSSDGSIVEYEQSITAVRDDLWNHLIAVYTHATNTVSFWLNGIHAGSSIFTTVTGDWFAATAALTTGKEDAGAYFSQLVRSQIVKAVYYSKILSQTEIESRYQEGARAVLFKTDWGARETVANVASDFISNTPFVWGSGLWRIVTEEIDGMQCKVLECLEAGFIYLPTSIFQVGETQAAYGTWEWYMNKAADSDSMVGFAYDQAGVAAANGYMFQLSSTERAELARVTAGVNTYLMRTPAAAYSASTWYKVRVARTNADSFSVYVDDNPIDLNLGTGTNPITDATYTSASHVVIDLDDGDKISLGDLKGDHAFIKFLGAVAYSTDGEFPVIIPT